MKQAHLTENTINLQITDQKVKLIFRLLFLSLLLLVGASSMYLVKEQITKETEQIIILNSHTIPTIELPPLQIEI